MKKIVLVIAFISFLCGITFAADVSIQKVEIAPLSGGVSFNTITFADLSATGWVTAPTVEMTGRKTVTIINTDATNSIYLTGVSGSTAVGTLKAGQVATFGASSGLHIYVSSNTVTSCNVWEIR